MNQDHNQSILITGISGYIGTYLATLFRQKGYRVSGCDLLPLPPTLLTCVKEFERFDLCDQRRTSEFFRKIKPTYVIHLAAFIEVGESEQKPLQYYHNNISSTLSVLQAMSELNLSKLIFASTAAVYATSAEILEETDELKPTSVYGRTKVVCEQIIQDWARVHDAHVLIFRFFNLIGPTLPRHCVHLFPMILTAMKEQKDICVYGNDYETPDGTCIRDYIAIEDLGEAHLLALEWFHQTNQERDQKKQEINNQKNQNKVEIVNLGTAHGYSVTDVISKFFELTKRVVPVKVVTRRKGDPAILVASNEKAKKLLGWSPHHSMETSIQQMYTVNVLCL